MVKQKGYYCYKCAAEVLLEEINGESIGKCPECKRKTEFVDFYPDIQNLVMNGYKNKIAIFPWDFLEISTRTVKGKKQGVTYRKKLAYITEEGKEIYGVF